MASKSSSRVIALAQTISENAKKLDEHLVSEGLPELSFDDEFPRLSPEMENVRNAILIASDEMTDLMLGPRQMVECEPAQHTSLLGIQAIARYDVAHKLEAGETVSYAELAKRCELPEDDLRRLLRQAMSRHVFKEPQEGYVAHNAASKVFLQYPLLSQFHYVALDEFWPAAAHMVDAMQKWPGSEEPNETGFNLAKGIDRSFFQSMADEPRREKAFADVMKYTQTQPGNASAENTLLEDFDWASSHVVVDVGGGTGATGLELVKNFPNLKCTVQDLPGVISKARQEVPPEAKDKVTFSEHDFFTEQPLVGADVYLFRWILHDWSDGKATKILRNLIPALKNGANIVLHEFVVPKPGTLPLYYEKKIRAFDLAMKAVFNSKERSIEDWTELLAKADKRFVVEAVKTRPGSGLATLHVVWRDS